MSTVRSGSGLRTYPHRRRTRSRLHISPAWLLLAALLSAGGLFWMTLRPDPARKSLDRGLELLARARTDDDIQSALDRWERESGPRSATDMWRTIRMLVNDQSLEDPRVRRLAGRLTGADYGDRIDDWRRWFHDASRIVAGRRYDAHGRDASPLEERWRAPIGLTGGFSTILPIEGRIYVGSLGAAFEDASDASDGVVRVDGASGAAELLFESRDKPHRDVVGIAAGEHKLFAACRSGAIYCLRPDGEVVWRGNAGAAIASAPIAVDVNRNGVVDVAVLTRAGKLVVLSGSNGAVAWSAAATTTLGGAAASSAGPDAGIVLPPPAVDNVIGDATPEFILTTPEGRMRVLAADNGRERWQMRANAPFAAGPIALETGSVAAPIALVSDSFGGIWPLVRSEQKLGAEARGAVRVAATAVATEVRTLRADRQHPAAAVVCISGAPGTLGGAVCLVRDAQLLWRYGPLGALPSPPAIADVTGDGRVEILVVSNERRPGGTIPSQSGPASAASDAPIGVLTVLSPDGHCLRRHELDAAATCGPVVGDVDGDGKLEVLIADAAGYLHCLSTDSAGPVEWGLSGGDIRNTRSAVNAYSYGQMPSKLQWSWRPR
jgi:hypothetical protein